MDRQRGESACRAGRRGKLGHRLFERQIRKTAMARPAIAISLLLAFALGLAFGIAASSLPQTQADTGEITPCAIAQASPALDRGEVPPTSPRTPIDRADLATQNRKDSQEIRQSEQEATILSRWNTLLADPNLDREGRRLLEKYREAIPRELEQICSLQEREQLSNTQLILYAMDFERFERGLYSLYEERRRLWPNAHVEEKDWQLFTTSRNRDIYWERLVTIYSTLSTESAAGYFKAKGLHLLFAREPQFVPVSWSEIAGRLRAGKGPPGS